MHFKFALFLLMALTACSQPEANQVEETEKEIARLPVEVQQVVTDSISSYYRTTAILEAPEEAEIVSRVTGMIESLHVEEGEYVKAGQLLARIDPQRHRLNLNKAQAELDMLEQELSRLKVMAQKQLVSEDALAKLNYRHQAALAERDLAKLQLEYSEVRTPIDGVVAARLVKRGKTVLEHQDILFHVVQQKQLHGVIHLPEKELARVHPGQEAELNLAGFTQPVKAEVLRVSPVVDANTGTFKTTLLVNNELGALKSGMFGEVRLKYATHNHALLIPRSALVRSDRDYSVFVVREGVAQANPIELGFEDGEQVEIIAGLSMDDHVVIRGQHQLKDQAAVEILPTLRLATR